MKSATKISAISKLELLQTQSNLETDDGEMIEDKNVQTGGQISASSSDEEIVKLEIQVGKSQKVFSIWTHPQKIRTKLVILKFSI